MCCCCRPDEPPDIAYNTNQWNSASGWPTTYAVDMECANGRQRRRNDASIKQLNPIAIIVFSSYKLLIGYALIAYLLWKGNRKRQLYLYLEIMWTFAEKWFRRSEVFQPAPSIIFVLFCMKNIFKPTFCFCLFQTTTHSETKPHNSGTLISESHQMWKRKPLNFVEIAQRIRPHGALILESS